MNTFLTTNAEIIARGESFLGIELGSTRIKAILISPDHSLLAAGSFEWENKLKNGLWTYSLDDAWRGVQTSYAELTAQVKERYEISIKKIAGIGISGMMHGYLPFDKDGRQLEPFRTWRNTNTAEAAKILTEKLNFNIPHRWSIAQLYQSVLNK